MIARRIISRQLSNQISSAVTEVEIGEEDLKDRDTDDIFVEQFDTICLTC